MQGSTPRRVSSSRRHLRSHSTTTSIHVVLVSFFPRTRVPSLPGDLVSVAAPTSASVGCRLHGEETVEVVWLVHVRMAFEERRDRPYTVQWRSSWDANTPPSDASERAAMSPPPSGPALPVHKTLLASAMATCTAEALTLPIDTAKVRLQLQKVKPGEAPMYSGMVGTIKTVAKEEGVAALWKGIVPGLHRQCVYGGLRIGLYDPVKQAIVGKDHVGEVPLLKKIVAALTTGAVGIAIASPTDLVKVRMQAEGKLPEGTPKRYPSALGAYRTIAKEEGVVALWRGVGPNMTRNAVINAAELATYDQIKEALLRSGAFTDNVVTHLISGLGAGFIAVCVGSPVDVVKSRLMGSQGEFTGTIDCFVKTLTREGPTAFYKGFVPNFGRLGSWNVAMFLVLEQARKALQ